MMLRRILFLMLICMGFAVNMAAQTSPVSTLPYYCGFEDAQENANWTLNRRGGIGASNPLPSQWTIGTGAKHSGFNGLYVSTGDQLDAAQYDGSREVFVVAEREFDLQPGSYDIAFDWRCLGDANSDAIFVYWVPATTTLTSRTTSTLPTNATPLTINTTNYLSGSASWTQVRSTVTVSSAQHYRLVFAWRNNTTNTYNPGGCLDNVQVNNHEATTDCWHSVTNLAWTEGVTADVLSWNGSASATYDIFYWMEGDLVVDSIMGVTGNSYTFAHGILKSGLYAFSVRTNCGSEQSLRVELLKVKSRGDFSLVAEACPDVDLIANKVIDGEKYLRPLCDESGSFRVKPQTVAGGGSIAGYRVDAIDYAECPFPFDYALAAAMMGNAGSGNYLRRISTDDVWDSQILTLPFKVCFFEGTYAQAVVCSNGIVSFDTQVAGKAAGYMLTGQPDIPSPDFGEAQGSGHYWRNAIYGVFQDYDPYYGGEIWYGVLGEWPCRKMVVCWNEVPMFNNHTTLNSSMIVMYEGTNVIDVYVKNRDLSPSGWNDNRGIIGLQNADGSDGVAAPGRNTSDGDNSGRGWSARREAWRFSPYSTPAYALTWYKGSFQTPTDVDNYILQHPEDPIELAIADSLNVNKEDGIDAVTVRLQYSQCNGDYIDIVDHARIQWPHLDTLVVDTFTCNGRPYSDRYINNATEAGTYDAFIKDSYGCDSIHYFLNLRILPKDTIAIDTVLCEGDVLRYGSFSTTQPGSYPVTLKYSNCDCDSVLQYVNFSYFNLDINQAQLSQTHYCPDLAETNEFYIDVETNMDSVLCTMTFDAKATTEGFVAQEFQLGKEGRLYLTEHNNRLLTTARAGRYNFDLTFTALGVASNLSKCAVRQIPMQFVINYPKSIVQDTYGTLLAILDDVAKDYGFVEYQWYKNGEIIQGATQQYYTLLSGETIDENTTWQVALKCSGDEDWIWSCPLGSTPGKTFYSDVQEVVASEAIPQDFDGTMTVYDVLGRVVLTAPYEISRLEELLNSRQNVVFLVSLRSNTYQHTFRLMSR